MADFGKRSRQDWNKLATRESKGKDPDSLTWQTPEGIPVRPLYTAEDLAGLDLPSRGAGPWFWITLGGSLALTSVAALYPIWRMNRMDAVRAVRTG